MAGCRIPKEVRNQVRGIVRDAFKVKYDRMYSEHGRIKFRGINRTPAFKNTTWKSIQNGITDALVKLPNISHVRFYIENENSPMIMSSGKKVICLMVRFNY